jgi:hypothetical protein
MEGSLAMDEHTLDGDIKIDLAPNNPLVKQEIAMQVHRVHGDFHELGMASKCRHRA